ncbi:MAG: GNAT family N-acetyltransferase [bacterium]|nr:GNAT family N-acetyltransferase [bacterium]
MSSAQNPWLTVSPAEYEAWLGAAGTDELAVLSDLFRDAYAQVWPAAVAILGCAVGTGIEHVDIDTTQRVVGVDINRGFLDVAAERFEYLDKRLELVCASLATDDWRPQPANFDLISASLLLEYLPPEILMSKIAGWLRPGGLFVCVSHHPDAQLRHIDPQSGKALAACAARMQPIEPADLEEMALRAGLRRHKQFMVPLGKGAFYSTHWFNRPGGPVAMIRARTSAQFALAERLIREYASGLLFDLDFQDIDVELADLAAQYAPPAGALILALADNAAGGCVAIRELPAVDATDRICELKRMYLRPAFRGLGHGRTLLEAAIAEARGLGYRRMRLDSVAHMTEANTLYLARGFKSVAPYRLNPQPDAVYLELDLASS